MANQSHSSGPQGHVTDPEHDGRLKENRDRGVHKGEETGSSSQGGTSHSTSSQGAVKDPEHDGRLKENRDRGVHKGDA
jgi:hypothetical protein